MKVGYLKAILKTVNNNVDVVVDTEAACYDYHLVDVKGAYFQEVDDHFNMFVIHLNDEAKNFERSEE